MDQHVEVSIEGRLLLPTGLTDGCVGITGGRIVAVKKVLEGERHYTLSNHLVVPGAVDMHVHFRQPGHPEKGTFATESKAAAFGGVTAVADMPNNDPPAVDPRSWKAKADMVSGTSFIDYAIYMGLGRGLDVHYLGMATGLFKLYIASSTGDLLVREREKWAAAMATALEAGGHVVVHAEDQASIEAAEPTGEELEWHHTHRPPLGEAGAVDLVGRVAQSTGRPGHAHVAHISCKEALAALDDHGMSAEVAPHHLLLDLRREDLGAKGKVNPPLRTDLDRAELWTALADGRIPIIASDHAPHTQEEKAVRFPDAPSGMPGVETMFPLLMQEVKNGRISLERLVNAVSVRPAAYLGLEPRGILVGNEAHLAVFDPKGPTRVDEDKLHQHCGWSPYAGMEAIFPRLVVSTAGVLVDDGELQMSRPPGRYVGLTLEDFVATDNGRRSVSPSS
jgi:dihydroorotase